MHREGRPQRNTIPLNLIIDGRKALVVGGGRVGLRKTKGLLVLTAGETVLRLMPPLNITAAHLDEGLEIIKASLQEA